MALGNMLGAIFGGSDSGSRSSGTAAATPGGTAAGSATPRNGGDTADQGVGASPSDTGGTPEEVLAAAEEFFNTLFPGESLTPDELFAKSDELGRQGITVLRNAAGTTAKIRLSNGAVIDVIGGAEAGRNIRQFHDTGHFLDLEGNRVDGPTGAAGGVGSDDTGGPGITIQKFPGGPQVPRPGGVFTGGRAVPRPPGFDPDDPFEPVTGPGLTTVVGRALRERRRAEQGGRQGTILGGFGSGDPSTRPKTLLGN